MRSQKDVEFDVCDLEAQLEYAETHRMIFAAVKIKVKLAELDVELEEITGHETAERFVVSLGA